MAAHHAVMCVWTVGRIVARYVTCWCSRWFEFHPDVDRVTVGSTQSENVAVARYSHSIDLRGRCFEFKV